MVRGVLEEVKTFDHGQKIRGVVRDDRGRRYRFLIEGDWWIRGFYLAQIPVGMEIAIDPDRCMEWRRAPEK